MKLMKPWLLFAYAVAAGTLLVGCGGDGSSAPYEADGPDGTQTPRQGVVSGPADEHVALGYENAPSSPESGVKGNEVTEGDNDGDGDGGDGDEIEDLCEDVTDPCAVCACENAGGDLTVCINACT